MAQLSDFFGKQARKRRKDLGLSQEDVAAKTGLSIPLLSEVERGRANPTLQTMEKIAAALGTSVAVMLDQEEALKLSPEQIKNRVADHLGKMSPEQLKVIAGLLDISAG